MICTTIYPPNKHIRKDGDITDTSYFDNLMQLSLILKL